MSASEALQKFMHDTLIADAGVHALIADRVYDRMPSSGDYPCVTFGPADALEDDAECIESEEIFPQIDVWSQKHGSRQEALRIAAAVKAALHRQIADLTEFKLIHLKFERQLVLKEPDGVTTHIPMTFLAYMETVSG